VRVVILGTGTNVGKTFVTARLAGALAQRCRVRALKPLESGVDPDTPGDAHKIADAAGHEPALSPWRFARPVSPHLAARETNARIEVAEVAAWVAGQERVHTPDITLIESAGGAFSPLAPGVTNADLARALDPARWLLVAPDSLGVLHDVTATLRALPRLPDAVVLSSARPPDASSGSNAAELRALGIWDATAVLGPGASDVGALVRWLLPD
jgi:dethiobiotin synthetase